MTQPSPLLRPQNLRIIDILATRYSTRPSEFVGYTEGKALLFDILTAQEGLKNEQEAQTPTGKMQSKRSKWDPAMIKELKEKEQWHQ